MLSSSSCSHEALRNLFLPSTTLPISLKPEPYLIESHLTPYGRRAKAALPNASLSSLPNRPRAQRLLSAQSTKGENDQTRSRQGTCQQKPRKASGVAAPLTKARLRRTYLTDESPLLPYNLEPIVSLLSRPEPVVSGSLLSSCAKYSTGVKPGVKPGVLGTVACAAGPNAALSGVAGTGVTYPEPGGFIPNGWM